MNQASINSLWRVSWSGDLGDPRQGFLSMSHPFKDKQRDFLHLLDITKINK